MWRSLRAHINHGKIGRLCEAVFHSVRRPHAIRCRQLYSDVSEGSFLLLHILRTNWWSISAKLSDRTGDTFFKVQILWIFKSAGNGSWSLTIVRLLKINCSAIIAICNENKQGTLRFEGSGIHRLLSSSFSVLSDRGDHTKTKPLFNKWMVNVYACCRQA